MRFRKRLSRHRPRRNPARKGDWVVLAGEACPTDCPFIIPCDSDATTANVNTFTLLDSQDLLEKADSMTVMRIVGDFNPMASWAFNTITSGGPVQQVIMVRAGIYKSVEDNEGAFTRDPFHEDDFGADCWLWLRQYDFIFDSLNNQGPGGASLEQWHSCQDYSPDGSHLDLRVKRKMQQGENLLLAVGVRRSFLMAPLGIANDGSNPVNFVHFTAQLRAYIKF